MVKKYSCMYMCVFPEKNEHVKVKLNHVIQICDQGGIGLLHINDKNVKYFCPIKTHEFR